MEKSLTAILVIQDLGISETNISSFEISQAYRYDRHDRRSIEKIRLFIKPKTEKHLAWEQDEENWLKFQASQERNGYKFEISAYQQID